MSSATVLRSRALALTSSFLTPRPRRRPEARRAPSLSLQLSQIGSLQLHLHRSAVLAALRVHFPSLTNVHESCAVDPTWPFLPSCCRTSPVSRQLLEPN